MLESLVTASRYVKNRVWLFNIFAVFNSIVHLVPHLICLYINVVGKLVCPDWESGRPLHPAILDLHYNILDSYGKKLPNSKVALKKDYV